MILGVDCWPTNGQRFDRIYERVKEYYEEKHQLANPRYLSRTLHEEVDYCFYVVLVYASRYAIYVKEMNPNHEYNYIRASKKL